MFDLLFAALAFRQHQHGGFRSASSSGMKPKNASLQLSPSLKTNATINQLEAGDKNL